MSLVFFQPDLLNFKKGWMTKLYGEGLVSECACVCLSACPSVSACVHVPVCRGVGSLTHCLVLSPQWKKHWFVLTDQSLRYYRDSIAEEVGCEVRHPGLHLI